MTVNRPSNPFWDTTRGALVALMEVSVYGQPSSYWKNRRMQGLPLARDPRIWYRGFGVQAGSTVPITALQMTANRVYVSFWSQLIGKPLSETQNGICAAGAGASVAVIAAPSETVLIHQQNTGMNLYRTYKTISFRYGHSSLFRGVHLIAVRDGIFTLNYIFGGKKVAEILSRNTNCDPTTASILGHAAMGGVAGLMSHPNDIAKTLMQSNLDLNTRLGTADTFRLLWRQNQWKAMYKAWIPRCSRYGVAAVVYSLGDEYLKRLIENS